MEEELKRKSFIFYGTYVDVMRKLPPEDALLYINTICNYYIDNTPIPESTGSFVVDIALTSIKEVMAANDNRYRNSVKGGAPKGNKNNSKGKNQYSVPKEDNLGQLRSTEDNLGQPRTTMVNQSGQPRTTIVDLLSKSGQPMVDQVDNGGQPVVNLEVKGGQPNVNDNDNVNVNVNVKENDKDNVNVKKSCPKILDCSFNIYESESDDFEYQDCLWEDEWAGYDWSSLNPDTKIDKYYSLHSLEERLYKEINDNGISGYRLPEHFSDELKKVFDEKLNHLGIKRVD